MSTSIHSTWRTVYLFEWGLHIHMVRQRIGCTDKKSRGLQSFLKLEEKSPQVIQTGGQVLQKNSIQFNFIYIAPEQ